MRTSRVFLGILSLSTFAALIPAIFPALDFAVARYFLQANAPLHPAQWLWVELVNEHVPTIFRTLVISCLLGWLVMSRLPKFRHWVPALAFIGLAGLIGPGLLVGALKDYTLRARPFHVTEFGGLRQFHPAMEVANECDDNCAFVSGHTADGFFFASLILLDRRRRWRWRWVAIGVSAGLIIGFARIAVGAHWLTDVLWAFPVTLVGSWIAWAVLSRVYHWRLDAPRL
jgi:lipid A 4'-phosphatase